MSRLKCLIGTLRCGAGALETWELSALINVIHGTACLNSFKNLKVTLKHTAQGRSPAVGLLGIPVINLLPLEATLYDSLYFLLCAQFVSTQ